MRFRPCIDIHNGKVKQIVGSSLKDEGSTASENFVSEKTSVYYAEMFDTKGLKGGHVIILNKKGTPEYDASYNECINALKAYPGGLQVGGGITPENAREFLDAGASHVIVTSYVFADARYKIIGHVLGSYAPAGCVQPCVPYNAYKKFLRADSYGFGRGCND